jgi:hypothetical protein
MCEFFLTGFTELTEFFYFVNFVNPVYTLRDLILCYVFAKAKPEAIQ